MDFAIWLYENHFILIDINNGVHIFKNEHCTKNINELYNEFLIIKQ